MLAGAPGHAKALYRKAVALDRLRRPREAAACLQRLVAADQANAEARVLLQRLRTKGSADDLERTLAALPSLRGAEREAAQVRDRPAASLLVPLRSPRLTPG